jgi:hypothetical protein
MSPDLPDLFRKAFFESVRGGESAEALKQSAMAGRLGEWTTALTTVVVAACRGIGWQASAKAHKLNLLPVQRSEYLALDVMAFPDAQNRWRFPSAVMELENQTREDLIAYSLWKLLSVRADLRVLFCYRRSPELAAPLVRHLREEVIGAMGLTGRVQLDGTTVLVIGSRSESDTFPYGFFNWWKLDTNTGTFGKF